MDMPSKRAILLALLYAVLSTSAFAEGEIDVADTCSSVVGRRSCACVLGNSNASISLWNITTSWHGSGPRFGSNDSIHWFYSFNPCLDFNLFENLTHKYPGYRPCHEVAAARWTTESVHRCDSLGNQAGGDFVIEPMNLSKFRSANLTLDLRNETTKNGAVISLICNKSLDIEDSSFRYLGVINKPLPTYYFELVSLCCCPGACALPPPHYPPDDGASLWWILGVVIGVLLVIAVVAAVVLETKKRRAQGGEGKPLLNPNP